MPEQPEVVDEYPPNFDEIKAAIPAAKGKGIAFTYSEKIYYPKGDYLPDHVICHEEVHISQQRKMGAKRWWSKYLSNEQFRLQQELEAYQMQFIYLRSHYSRKDRRTILNKISKDLSSAMYGSIISKEQAKQLIAKGGMV